MLVSPSTNARVLIVEDDPELNHRLSDLLRGQGYRIRQCFEGDGGLACAVGQRFDLILLDVLLPRMDGFAVLKELRKSRQTPVMILTACGAEEERIQGFSRGADDYLPKPFNFTELLLRIEALLRRTRVRHQETREAGELCIDELVLNRRDQTVRYAGKPVVLTPVQFRLLWSLMQHAGESLSKPFLYQQVLERDFSRHDRSLDMHVSRVRRKLTAVGMLPDRLQTLHGKGYSFE